MKEVKILMTMVGIMEKKTQSEADSSSLCGGISVHQLAFELIGTFIQSEWVLLHYPLHLLLRIRPHLLVHGVQAAAHKFWQLFQLEADLLQKLVLIRFDDEPVFRKVPVQKKTPPCEQMLRQRQMWDKAQQCPRVLDNW